MFICLLIFTNFNIDFNCQPFQPLVAVDSIFNKVFIYLLSLKMCCVASFYDKDTTVIAKRLVHVLQC